MNYHYVDSNNQTAGPVSLDDIRALIREGKLPADPMICATGSSDWTKLPAVSRGDAAAVTSLPFSGTILADFVGRLVRLVGGILSPALVQQTLTLARNFGQYAVLLGGALGFIAAVIAAIRYNSFGLFLGGIGFVVVLAVAQFAASKFLGASDELIRSTPSRLSSTAFLECIGLLAVLGSLAVLLAGFVFAIMASSLGLIVPAVLGSVFLAFLGAIALHPVLASVESGSGSAGEEAIGIIAFFLKAALKMVPLAFALLAAVGSLALIVGMVAPNSQFAFVLSTVMPDVRMPGLIGPGLGGAGAVVVAALLPMLAYVVYLISSLPLELWRAILSLPGKLDALRRADQAA